MKIITGAVLAFFVFFNYTTCVAKQTPLKSVSSTILKYIMIFFCCYFSSFSIVVCFFFS